MMLRRGGPRPAERMPHPGRVIAGVCAGAVAVGTALLSLPFATPGPARPPLLDALFTATSAVCVTGLVTVDTGTYWSGFGQAVILLLIQIGGLGIMTLAGLVVVLFTHRLGMRASAVAQAETKALSAADLRRLIGRIVVFSLVCEAAAAIVLTTRFWSEYGMSLPRAVYEGVFHGISAFKRRPVDAKPTAAAHGLAGQRLVWVSRTHKAACRLPELREGPGAEAQTLQVAP